MQEQDVWLEADRDTSIMACPFRELPGTYVKSTTEMQQCIELEAGSHELIPLTTEFRNTR